MFESATDTELLEVMGAEQRADRIALARQWLAIGRFTLLRLGVTNTERESWCTDDWDAAAAEVGAELGVGRGRASKLMEYGQALVERLPRVAERFLAGEVDVRVVATIIYRTELITDADACATIDELIAERARRWHHLSYPKLTQLIDWLVLDVDPDALRRAKDKDDDRRLKVTRGDNGMAEIWGRVRAVDGEALNAKLDALAATVCADDPRTTRQRRADAISALVAGDDAMACECGSGDCPATGEVSSPVVIHMVAEQATVEGRGTKPAYLSGYGAVPAPTVTALAKHAKLRPIVIPKDTLVQPQYRPSAALSAFVRARDLTCRWMNCDRPAWQADIDHTVPYPYGPTHPSNNDCFCRHHHLLKTFYAGIGGWIVRQQPDGTVVFTSPTGRTYNTQPFGALLFPQLGAHTGELPPMSSPPPGTARGLAMPKRRTTRAQNRAARIQAERDANAARDASDPPPF
jgi:hypothetical protein